MPAPLNEDAAAYVQQRGAPLTADSLNRAMQILRDNPELRPSYGGMGAVTQNADPSQQQGVSSSRTPVEVRELSAPGAIGNGNGQSRPPIPTQRGAANSAAQSAALPQPSGMRGEQGQQPNRLDTHAQGNLDSEVEALMQKTDAVPPAASTSAAPGTSSGPGVGTFVAAAGLGAALGAAAHKIMQQTRGDPAQLNQIATNVETAFAKDAKFYDPSARRQISAIAQAIRTGNVQQATQLMQQMTPDTQTKMLNMANAYLRQRPTTAGTKKTVGNLNKGVGSVAKAIASRGRRS